MTEDNKPLGASKENRQTYTRRDVINQSLIAFGQGTNFMRVSSRACREIERLMVVVDESRSLHERWGTIAVQILERVRSIGRVARAWAVEDGETVIGEEYIGRAFRKVKLTSKTVDCDEDENGGGDPRQ
ncbi:MAG: hypothetical protein AAFX50_15840, partial [Acidobacteriota bacterium]